MTVDAFMFFDELDLLEIRLNELAGTVDTFILVESRQTHQGNPKPLVYAENRDRFAAFPIHHVVVEQFPEGLDAWGRENYQRNAIGWGWEALSVGGDDLVIVSDLDEIPSAEAVREAQEILARYAVVTVLAVHHHVFFLNTYFSGTLPRVRICRRKHIALPQHSRDVYGPPALAIERAGWHWSYLGGVEAIQKKLAAYCHPESNVPPFNEAGHIAACLQTRTDLYGNGSEMQVTDLAAPPSGLVYPLWLTQNQARFASLMYPPSPDIAPRGGF